MIYFSSIRLKAFGWLLGAFLIAGLGACKPSAYRQSLPVGVWTTTADSSLLLRPTLLGYSSERDKLLPVLEINPAQKFQTVDGFGFTLTGGSATLLYQLPPKKRTAILQELFGTGPEAIGVSYLRLSIGASDLDPAVFSYDDLPAGETDPGLTRFHLSKDTLHLIPILREIRAIRPDIRLMGSPWSAPVWMKTNGSSIGGNLEPRFYAAYARYFVKYIQAMQGHGIDLDAVTVQNEPQHGGNNPSMVMSAEQQADFVKNHLGPAFRAARISTKILIWDHNCDRPDFPLSILNDPVAKEFIAGTAFHLYAGDISALSKIQEAHPDKALYFTEQWTGAKGHFDGDLQWHVRNVVIGSMRNWSRVALEWNLANDPGFGPHTPGGCTECKGALTINGPAVTRNVSYYIIAQASRFVPPGSVRIGSAYDGALAQVAFRTPAGKTVLIALNEDKAPQSFNIRAGDRWIRASVPGAAVSTFVW